MQIPIICRMDSPSKIVRHVMPGDDDAAVADTTWFRRQNAFERDELRHLVTYKRDNLRVAEDGVYSKHPTYTYPHILPAVSLRKVFHEPMAEAIFSYLKKKDIQQHTELLNLKSSQAACLNLLFPLRLHPSLATAVLRPILPGLSAVTGIEFEYTAQEEDKGECGCTRWLGEPPGGKRGQNRTSIDAAVFWTDTQGKRCATLIEFKYTERSFGVCSACDKAKGEAKRACLEGAFADRCLLTSGGPYRSRLYWKRLTAAGIDLEKMRGVAGCPFRGSFYQLMRQFLIARYMLETGLAERTEVIVLHFRRNAALQDVPAELNALAATSVLDAWNSVLVGVPAIRGIEAEAIMEAYDAASGVDASWRDFIRKRYRI